MKLEDLSICSSVEYNIRLPQRLALVLLDRKTPPDRLIVASPSIYHAQRYH